MKILLVICITMVFTMTAFGATEIIDKVKLKVELNQLSSLSYNGLNYRLILEKEEKIVTRDESEHIIKRITGVPNECVTLLTAYKSVVFKVTESKLENNLTRKVLNLSKNGFKSWARCEVSFKSDGQKNKMESESESESLQPTRYNI